MTDRDPHAAPQGTEGSAHGFLRLLLVGTDGSEGSRRALEWAARLAATCHAEVLAVHVLTYSREALRDITLDTMRTWRQDLLHELQTSWIEPLESQQANHRCALVEADSPGKGLLETAEREGADLLVVGARGRDSLAGRMLGSTSYTLAHRARQPVVVVPPDWVDKPS